KDRAGPARVRLRGCTPTTPARRIAEEHGRARGERSVAPVRHLFRAAAACPEETPTPVDREPGAGTPRGRLRSCDQTRHTPSRVTGHRSSCGLCYTRK